MWHGSPPGRYWISNLYSAYLDMVGLRYQEKDHLTKVEVLCRLVVQKTTSTPSSRDDIDLDEINLSTRIRVYRNLIRVRHSRGELFKISNLEYTLLYLECRTSQKKWYRDTHHLVNLFLLLYNYGKFLSWLLVWTMLATTMVRVIFAFLHSGTGISGLVSAVLS
ncbi:hypothetical protein BDV12DRAFT_172752 [Aspergillus spectabilis]